ncbi:hypothetical protein BJX76DRAFT_342827 [Aspergillus varians]
MCFAVHVRCWQLLCTHKAWSFSRGDIKIIMRALRRKSAQYWTRLFYSFGKVLHSLAFAFW